MIRSETTAGPGPTDAYAAEPPKPPSPWTAVPDAASRERTATTKGILMPITREDTPLTPELIERYTVADYPALSTS